MVVSLMPGYRPDAVIAWRHGQAISHARFLGQVARLADSLPDADYLINLCEDRYRFMLTLCAALTRGCSTLLPPNRLASTLGEIGRSYPGCVVLGDALTDALDLPFHLIREPRMSAGENLAVPAVSDRPDGIIAFTSGSTGSPQPHWKRWSDQMRCSDCAMRRFGITTDTSLVATVPPQHMFGLELSVLIPLASGAAVHAGRPFFPQDIQLALSQVPPPRILVTTPVHLSACAQSDLEWPTIDRVISATAPLGQELARVVEDHLQTAVFEIYGCTEAGSVASRRTLEGPRWRWYDTVVAEADDRGVTLTAGFLPGPIPLSDRLRLEDDQHFQLLGRGSDMVNIAGKRASLADLNLKLNAVDGVEDGVLLIPEEQADRRTRLAAIVVAPGLDRATLIKRLRERIDPVFLPRPILFVDQIPRNEVGKSPRQWLLTLLRQQQTPDDR